MGVFCKIDNVGLELGKYRFFNWISNLIYVGVVNVVIKLLF